jgi:hypothetical protein
MNFRDGFFCDRQRNQCDPGNLTYFLNYDRMNVGLSNVALDRKIGFRVVARPESGLAYYSVAELRSDVATVQQLLRQNETVMLEITVRRAVDLAVFRLSNSLRTSEISIEPLKELLPWDTDKEENRRQKFTILADRLELTQDPEERKRIRQQLSRLLFWP